MEVGLGVADRFKTDDKSDMKSISHPDEVVGFDGTEL